MRMLETLTLGLGMLLAMAWLVGLVAMIGRGAPAKGTVLAATGFSWIYFLGGAGCVLIFGPLWAAELAPYATGARDTMDGMVALWSAVLSLLGMVSLWMTLVRRVWCTSSGLIRRTWSGRIQQVPYSALAGRAEFHYDDVILPCEEKVVLDVSQPGFWKIVDCLEIRGVDFTAMPGNHKRRLDKKRSKNAGV